VDRNRLRHQRDLEALYQRAHFTGSLRRTVCKLKARYYRRQITAARQNTARQPQGGGAFA
jgi:hypothetical protein